MGSVASTNVASTSNGLSDLLQTLTNDNSPLLSTLSSPNVQAALESAPASDIVEISAEAQQLQTADALFGSSDTSTSSLDNLFSALAAGGSSGTSQETQALFGTPSTTTSNSLFDVFA